MNAHTQIKQGILYMLIGVASFGFMDALVKWLAQEYSYVEILFFRCFFGVLPIFVMFERHQSWAPFKTLRLHVHVVRGGILVLSSLFFVISFANLPLADVTAICFASPLFVTALSVPFLKERVRWHRWSAVIIGFCGTLIMVQPGASMFQPISLVAVLAAFVYACGSIHVRYHSNTETPQAQFLWSLIVATIFSSFLLPFGWKTPDFEGLCLFMMLGFFGGLAHLCMAQSFSRAPASFVTPLEYTGLLWAVLFDVLIWSHAPSWTILGGASIVIACGLYILYRETKLKPKEPPLVQDAYPEI